MNLVGCSSFRSTRAFTLIEMLVSILICAILAVLLTASVKFAIGKANGAKCLSNLRQLAIATFNYATENDGCLPSRSSPSNTFWYLTLRPYLGATQPHPGGLNANVRTFYCPSVSRTKGQPNSGYPDTDYGVNGNIFQAEPGVTKVTQIQSPQKIALYSECLYRAGNGTASFPASTWLISPSYVTSVGAAVCFPQNRHGECFNMVFADGHAESVLYNDVVANFKNYFGDKEVWK